MQARFYLPQYGRFTSPDPARDQHFENTQSWNIYSYCWNNPVMLTDPTGMMVFVDGDRSKDYLAALQKAVSFNVELSDKGQVTATVDKDQKLSKSDKALLGAINDEKHTVSIHAISNDQNVFLGRSDGAHTGEHTIAFDQAKLLDGPKNSGGFTSAQLVGHETLEGYYESKGSSYVDAHNATNKLFPGLERGNVTNLLANKGGDIAGLKQNFTIFGTNNSMSFSLRFFNPVPKDPFMKGQVGPQPAFLFDVEKVK